MAPWRRMDVGSLQIEQTLILRKWRTQAGEPHLAERVLSRIQRPDFASTHSWSC